MKLKTIFLGATVIGLSTIAIPAWADGGRQGWSFRIGVGDRDGYFDVGYRHDYRNRGRYRRSWRRHNKWRHHDYSYRRCLECRQPVYKQVWVAPVFERVFVGCDRRGRPIYQRALTRRGYYKSVLSHYTYRVCGVPTH